MFFSSFYPILKDTGQVSKTATEWDLMVVMTDVTESALVVDPKDFHLELDGGGIASSSFVSSAASTLGNLYDPVTLTIGEHIVLIVVNIPYGTVQNVVAVAWLTKSGVRRITMPPSR